MPRITLVCSAHRTNGLCNAEALLQILLAVDPDVIFQETRSSDVDSTWSVESQAIPKFGAFRACQRVAVDRYELSSSLHTLRSDTDRVFDFVEQTSGEYRRLRDDADRRVHLYGFEYLNSEGFALTSARLCEIEETTIAQAGHPGLIRALSAWRSYNRDREGAMVGHIYEYCRQNAFRTGVFLVGAAHKTDIATQIGLYSASEPDLVSWDLSYRGSPP